MDDYIYVPGTPHSVEELADIRTWVAGQPAEVWDRSDQILDGLLSYMAAENRWVQGEWGTTDEGDSLEDWDVCGEVSGGAVERMCLVGAARHFAWVFLLDRTPFGSSNEAEAVVGGDLGYQLACARALLVLAESFDLEDYGERFWAWCNNAGETFDMVLVNFNDDRETTINEVRAVIRGARQMPRPETVSATAEAAEGVEEPAEVVYA